METATTATRNFTVELMKAGAVEPVRGFRLPATVVSLEAIERVTALSPVPYAGDERPIAYIRQHVDEFMLRKPA
ncbi:MAG TPA: hypothetical protein VHC21_02060 [Candidatus Saccharimonadales bacterium]|nr:hypothetical protein [Candidatus Saccharimonadales bacterium]